ncbi:MAG: hypothetical protein ACHQIG_10990 [Acidimicrobiia bacterium]
MATAAADANACNALDDAPLFRLSRVRLVFGPCDSVPPLLRALADALEPVALVPSEVRCSISHDGCRLRVTCDLDPARPDLARVLVQLLRRRGADRPAELARSA